MEEYNAYVGLDVHKDTITVQVEVLGQKERETRLFNSLDVLRFMCREKLCVASGCMSDV